MTYAAVSLGINQDLPPTPPSGDILAMPIPYDGGSGYYATAWDAITPITGTAVLAFLRKTMYANGKYYAFDFNGAGSVGLYSTNGTSWSTMSSIPVDFNGNVGWELCAYGNGIVLLYNPGSPAGFVKSTDNGVTWSSVYAPPWDGISGLAFGNGYFVAIQGGYDATGQKIYYSSDAVSWTGVTVSNRLEQVIFYDGYFNAVGTAGYGRSAGFYTSTDGVNWTSGTSDYTGFSGFYLTSSDTRPMMEVDHPDGAAILTSSNHGATWTTATTLSTFYLGLYYLNGAWIMFDGNVAGVYSTNNGVSWTGFSPPSGATGPYYDEKAAVGAPST